MEIREKVFETGEPIIIPNIDNEPEILHTIGPRKKTKNISYFCLPIQLTTENLDGIYPPLVTPFDEKDEVDYELFSKEIELYVTLDQKKIIGGYLIMHTNSSTSIIFYNVVINKTTYKQVAMLQLYHSMKIAKHKKQHYVDFGVSHIPTNKNPLDPKFSLIQFKEQFGAVGVQRIAYYKEL